MNKVMLIGNVGKDPDVHYFDADQAVANVRLATTERGYTLKNGTQVPDRTDWHNLVFGRQLAKIVEQYVHKGDKLYVEGRIRYAVKEDQFGKRQYVTEILVENMEMLTPKQRSAHSDQPAVQPTADQPAVQPTAKPAQPAAAQDDKLPF